jgi:threonine dehydrogenase-like Zn-dependent dehydrogenase
MKAVLFDRELRLVDLPKPCFTGNESVIRLLKAGICNTDLEITKGYFGFKGVLGHEFVGVVEHSRNTSLVGQKVVGEINAACGHCEYCQKKLQRHCPGRTVLGILNRDGAFREYLTLPESNLHVVPDSITDDEALFVEPLAAACEILDQVEIEPDQRVAILGDGKLGLLITMVLNPSIRQLCLIGKHSEKMEFARELGVETVESSYAQKPLRSFDFVIEASGSPQGWDQALRLVKPRGTVVLKSTFHGEVAFNPAPIVVDEITVIGSRCGRFEPALQLLRDKKVDPARLLQHSFPLGQALEAFEMAGQSGVLKVVLQSE